MRYLIIFAASMLFSGIAIGQFQTGPNWVTEYLESGGSIEDVTGLLGETPDPNKFKSVKMVREIPSYWDWREVVGGLQPIRNQGSCGSCWAFAATAVLESVLAIDGYGFNNDLAEQTPVSTCSSSGSCAGGYFTVFNYLQNQGLPWEDQDPYQARNTRCKQGLTPAYKIHDWFYVGSGSSPTVEEIKSAILRYGPVAVDVNGSFGSYRSGIYDNCNSYGTNHMVTIEGWSDQGEYWIMRNSWGRGWGEDGYMRIKWEGRSGRKCNNIGRVVAAVMLRPSKNGEGGLAGKFGVTLD